MTSLRHWCSLHIFGLLCLLEIVSLIGLTSLMFVIGLTVLGVFTVAFSLLVKAGMLHQVRILIHHHSAKEHSWPVHTTNAVSYLLWGVYGWRKPDYVNVVGQGAGFVLSLIVLTLVFKYRLGRQLTEFKHYVGSPCQVCDHATDSYAEEGLTEKPDIGQWPKPCYTCGGHMHALHLVQTEEDARAYYAVVMTQCDTCNRRREFWTSLKPDPEEPSELEYWLRNEDGDWRRVGFKEYQTAERRAVKAIELNRHLDRYRLDDYMLSWQIDPEFAGVVTTRFTGSPNPELEELARYVVSTWSG